MRVDWPRIIGLALVLGVFAVILLIASYKFPLFSYVEAPRTVVPAGEADRGLCGVLWGRRQMDLLAQAVLLFAATASCVAILRGERR